jgi:hypothetical protein
MLKTYVGCKGPMVAYPIGRLTPSDDEKNVGVSGTPLDRLCIDDLLRECLGTQACAYILDVSSRTGANKGIFTCSYAGTMGKFIPGALPRKEHVAAMAVKEEWAFVKDETDSVLIFITHIQDRINSYVDFMEGLLTYLDEQEKKQPAMADFTGRLRTQVKKDIRIFSNYASALTRADGAKRAVPILAKVYKALDLDTPEVVQAGVAAPPGVARGIGDPQDTRVNMLRMKAQVLRAMATMEMAKNPAAAEIAREVRKRTEEALRNPVGYEKATAW